MAVRQYVGARYVPFFYENPDGTNNYNSEAAYEALTIVTYNNSSYVSVKAVPAGILPTNTEYWILTGIYNAQVEQYRQEVEELSITVADNKTAADTAIANVQTNLDTEVGKLKAGAYLDVDSSVSDSSNLVTNAAVKTYVDAEATKLDNEILPGSTTIFGTAAYEDYTTSVESGNEKLVTSGAVYTALGNRGHIVLIGDSWSSSYSSTAYGKYSDLAERYGFTLHNYAVSGSGYAVSNNLFITQLSSSYNDLADVKTNVEYVVVVGGINDFTQSVEKTTLQGNYGSFWATAHSDYPNAILVQILNVPDYSLTSFWNLWNWLKYSDGLNVQKTSTAAWFETASFNDDSVHPVSDAQNVLAYNVFAYMLGYDVLTLPHQANATGDNSFSLHIADYPKTWGGYVRYIYFAGKPTNVSSTLSHTLTFSKRSGLLPTSTVPFGPLSAVFGAANSGNIYGPHLANTDGSCEVLVNIETLEEGNLSENYYNLVYDTAQWANE